MTQRRFSAYLFFALIGLVCGLLGFIFGAAAAARTKKEASVNVTSDEISKGAIRWTFDESDPMLAKRTILVSTEINEMQVQRVIGSMYYLDAANSSEPIQLLLDSTGGLSSDARAIIDAMHLIKAPVNTWAIGTCRSAAANILISATGKRYVTPNASICFHYFPVPDGAKRTSREYVERSIDGALWRQQTKLPNRYIDTKTEATVYFTPSQAIEFKIADELANPK